MMEELCSCITVEVREMNLKIFINKFSLNDRNHSSNFGPTKSFNDTKFHFTSQYTRTPPSRIVKKSYEYAAFFSYFVIKKHFPSTSLKKIVEKTTWLQTFLLLRFYCTTG